MTTADITIVSGNTKEKSFIWGWHDGDQIDYYICKILKENNVKTFGTPKEIGDMLTNSDKEQYGLEDGSRAYEGADWNWVMTILGDKEALLVGIGAPEKVTKRIIL